MNIAGVDYDTRRADVVLLDLDTDHARWERYVYDAPRNADAFARARAIRPSMPTHGWWEDAGVILIALEDPLLHTTRVGTGALYRAQGCILATLPSSVDVWQLAPYEWRLAVGLPGSGPRDRMKALARDLAVHRGAQPEWPQDAIDAFCIALAARTMLERAAEKAETA